MTHYRLSSLELIVLGPPIVVHIVFRPVDAIVEPQWAHYPYAELIQTLGKLPSLFCLLQATGHC